MNKKNRLAKLYLGHFAYVPAIIIYSLVVGEDVEILIFFGLLSLIIGGFAFLFNYLITFFALTLFKANILFSFFLPTVAGLILYKPIAFGFYYLDVGGHYAYWIFLIVSLVVNLIAFLILKVKSISTNRSS